MNVFADWREELMATQDAAEELLQQIADGTTVADTHALNRLDRLSSSCAKLAYGNDSADSLSDSVHNLVAWCDHLDDPMVKAEFLVALLTFPLTSPLART